MRKKSAAGTMQAASPSLRTQIVSLDTMQVLELLHFIICERTWDTVTTFGGKRSHTPIVLARHATHTYIFPTYST